LVNISNAQGATLNSSTLIGKYILNGSLIRDNITNPLRIYVWANDTFGNVTEKFISLPFDDKQSFAGVVLAYYHTVDNKVDIAVLKDYRNQKQLGTISRTGLRMD